MTRASSSRFPSEPIRRHIPVGGLQIYCQIAGEGSPAIILLHGFGASLFTWRLAIPPLANYGTVVAYDRPAFGLTERPRPPATGGLNPYAPESQPVLLTGLMDALGIERAVLVGHSAGGTVALATALRYPQRVQALALIDAAIYDPGGTPTWLLPLVGLARRLPWPVSLLPRLAPYGQRAFDIAWHDPGRITPDVFAGYAAPYLQPGWGAAFLDFLAANPRRPAAWELHRLQMPVLVMTGDDDRIVPTRDSRRLASELPNAELVVIRDCGHIPQEERPQEFLQAIASFLRRYAATPDRR